MVSVAPGPGSRGLGERRLSEKSSSGVIDGAVTTVGTVVSAISNPVLIFLVVLVGAVLGLIAYIWHSQRVEALEAYSHLVDKCLPSREKM